MDPLTLLGALATLVTIAGGIGTAVYFYFKEPRIARRVLVVTGGVVLILVIVVFSIAQLRGSGLPVASSTPTGTVRVPATTPTLTVGPTVPVPTASPTTPGNPAPTAVPTATPTPRPTATATPTGSSGTSMIFTNGYISFDRGGSVDSADNNDDLFWGGNPLPSALVLQAIRNARSKNMGTVNYAQVTCSDVYHSQLDTTPISNSSLVAGDVIGVSTNTGFVVKASVVRDDGNLLTLTWQDYEVPQC